jgi:hypothetical protein
LKTDSAEEEENEEEDSVAVLNYRTLQAMVEEKPPQANEGSRYFKKDESSAQRHCEVLLPKCEVVRNKRDNMMGEGLFVHRGLKAHITQNQHKITHEVSISEEYGPYVAITRDFTALFVIEKVFVAWTSP